MKHIIALIICTCLTLTGFANKSIVPTSILNLYQPDLNIKLVQKDIDFWTKKMRTAPNQSSYLIKLSGAHSQLFSLTGRIEDLKKAESLLTNVLATPIINRSNVLRALAHNYISQHRFCEALDLILAAAEIGENKFASDKMLFDVYMELGNEEQAQIQLTKITNNDNFDYLIRKSKWEDSKGNLAGAITHLERAKMKAIETNNKALMAWIYSNLGDYYGHNGEIQKSFDHFKKTLELAPANWYALKGISWIAYAKDKNIALAKDLIYKASFINNSPDLHLKLAELAHFESNKQQRIKSITKFSKAITNEGYGDMYNKYECLVAAEFNGDFETAYRLAKKEINNRPTPESYDLLAWSLFLDGQIEAAQKLAKTHILRQSSEPEILLHLAFIFRQKTMISSPILKELETAHFELGPLKTKEIKNLSTAISILQEKKDWSYHLTPNIQNPFWFLG